ANGRVQIFVLLEPIQGELRLGPVEARLDSQRSLELLLGLRVVAAALIGQPRVVERLRQMVSSCRLLLLGGSQKGLRHALARLVVPARRLVLLHECVERAVEALLCLLGNQIAAAVLLAGGLPWLELLSATATGH